MNTNEQNNNFNQNNNNNNNYNPNTPPNPSNLNGMGNNNFGLSNTTRGGLITGIVGASLLIVAAIGILALLGPIESALLYGLAGKELEIAKETWAATKTVIIGMLIPSIIGSGVTIAIAALALSKKSNGLITAGGVLTIFFGFGLIGIIGGILTLTGNSNKTQSQQSYYPGQYY